MNLWVWRKRTEIGNRINRSRTSVLKNHIWGHVVVEKWRVRNVAWLLVAWARMSDEPILFWQILKIEQLWGENSEPENAKDGTHDWQWKYWIPFLNDFVFPIKFLLLRNACDLRKNQKVLVLHSQFLLSWMAPWSDCLLFYLKNRMKRFRRIYMEPRVQRARVSGQEPPKLAAEFRSVI